MENNSKYIISEATEKEFKEILRIKNDSKSNTYEFEQKQFFVARDNGKMVGFARLRVDKKTGKVDLGGLYVDPDYRGTKIGYDLFKHILDNSDFEEYFLDCIKPLENYYLKFGFIKLEKPEDFQIEKIKGIYKMYNLEYDEKEVLEKTLFMKYEKKEKPLILILHCWEGKPEDNWYISLKLSLEKIGYKVIIPELPNTNTPNLDEQLEFLNQFTNKLNKNSVIIGHSLGGQLASLFVSKLNKKIKSVIMVTPTYPLVADDMLITSRKTLNESEKAFIKYTSKNIDFEKVSKNTDFQILHISKDDPYINFEKAKSYYEKLDNIKVREYNDKKHFNGSSGLFEFKEILEDIQNLNK